MMLDPKIFVSYDCFECHQKATVRILTMTPRIWRCSHCVSIFDDLRELLRSIAE